MDGLTPSYREYMELRDIVIRKNAEIERLKDELAAVLKERNDLEFQVKRLIEVVK